VFFEVEGNRSDLHLSIRRQRQMCIRDSRDDARARNFAADWAPLLDFVERCAQNPHARA